MNKSTLWRNNASITNWKRALKAIAMKRPKPTIDPDKLISHTAEAFGIKPDDITGPRRFDRIAFPRQVVMFIAHKHGNYSSTQAARMVGRSDHCTTLHACKSVSNRMETEPREAKRVGEILSQITNQ